MSAQPSNTDNEFLQQQLSTLLASPYIHFNSPQSVIGHRQLHMGPGPVDLFTTRFNRIFTDDATGVVRGTDVDREGLKQALLDLQKQWSPDTARFETTTLHETKFVWRPSSLSNESDEEVEVIASAEVDEHGTRIRSLSLDGDQSLFPSLRQAAFEES